MRDTSSHAAAGVSRDDIATAALRLVRRNGVAALTMRALAAELGIRASSLYHHVTNKEQVLDLVAREAFAFNASDAPGFEQVISVDDWIDVIRETSLSLLHFYREHPGLAAAILAYGDPRANRPEISAHRVELDTLVSLGVPADIARHVLDCAARWTVAAIAVDGSPHSGRVRDDELFRGGLNLLLAGMRARIAASTPHRS